MMIPLDRLMGACKDQLDIVLKEWPDGIPLTEEAAERALELKLDIDWAADNLLISEGGKRDEYDSASESYMDNYYSIIGPEREKFAEVQALAWEKYKSIVDPAYASYKDMVNAEYKYSPKERNMAEDHYRIVRENAWAESEHTLSMQRKHYYDVLETAHAELQRDKVKKLLKLLVEQETDRCKSQEGK